MGVGSVASLGRDTGCRRSPRGEQEENKRKARARQEENKSAPPMLLACTGLADGFGVALRWLWAAFALAVGSKIARHFLSLENSGSFPACRRVRSQIGINAPAHRKVLGLRHYFGSRPAVETSTGCSPSFNAGEPGRYRKSPRARSTNSGSATTQLGGALVTMPTSEYWLSATHSKRPLPEYSRLSVHVATAFVPSNRILPVA